MGHFLTEELFVVPYENDFLVIAPLKGAFLKVNGATISHLQAVERGEDFPEGESKDQLVKTGILIEEKEPAFFSKCEEDSLLFEPEAVTIFNTSDCSMRCTYCYGNAGCNVKVIDQRIALAAIDFIISNTIKHGGKKSVHVGFHGGGEPLFGKGFEIAKLSVAYTKQRCQELGLKCDFSTGTNGVLSHDQLNWIVGNLKRATVSLDGPPEFQDVQRPLRTGKPSSPYVLRAIKFLAEHNFRFGLRATITKESVRFLKEIADYFMEVAPSVKMVHFEPLFECGRCKTTGAQAPSSDDFMTAMLEVIPYTYQRGYVIYYSGSELAKLTNLFCGGSGKNFCLTPWGQVTSCFEVSLPDDRWADPFIFGEFNPQSRTVENLPGCQDCFLKFSCAGDCMAKAVEETGNIFHTENSNRCQVNQGLAMFNINQILMGNMPMDKKEV